MAHFENFTNLYPLSKTLRLELLPIKETKEIFAKWINEESQNCDDNLFLNDKKIAEAYIVIKSILDKVHEEYINISLSSDIAKKIDFSTYFNQYKNRDNLNETEKELRKKIGETYKKGDEYFAKKLENSSSKGILQNSLILKYIYNNVQSYSSAYLSEDMIKLHLKTFDKFFTYLEGYNTNRGNYYEVNNEKSTAIATRIIHENLPKFCDNIIRFECRKEEYLNIKEELKEIGIITTTKDAVKGKFEETIPITDEYFKINYFNKCLSQSEIEDYNKLIGNYNSLINLYNQAKKKEKKSFVKIDEFTMLYKQIGCGKRTVFPSIIKDRDKDLPEEMRNRDGIYSLESILNKIKITGEIFFQDNKNSYQPNIYHLIDFLQSCNDWRGIYWNKNAVDKISSYYFTCWNTIRECLKDKKECATYDISREEPLQLRDAVELSGLFDSIDKEESKFLFKRQFIENGDIDITISPSKNIIKLICNDIKTKAKQFISQSEDIINIKEYQQNEYDNNNNLNIIKIKEWLDLSIDIMRMIHYFYVRPSKMKGNIANPELEQILATLLQNSDIDWFGWYDLIRNYLAQKPQDKVKNNKLKLNFGSSKLLKGFVDSHTDNSDNGTQYGGYIFRKKHKSHEGYEYFLGISKNTKLFRSHLQNKIAENDKSEYQRLDYYQIKDTTLYPNEYGNCKKSIRNIIREIIDKDKELNNNEYININKILSADNTTPSQLFKALKNSNSYSYVLKDGKLLEKVNETIKLIIDYCLKFTRIKAIKEVTNSTYKGCDGFDKLISDLSNISKSKVFNYFYVSNTEFNEHNGKDLFLFKITNKDLSYYDTHSKGLRKERYNQKENLHTLYFRALMHEDSYGDIVDMGNGEIFYREKAFEYKDEIWAKGHHAKELNGKFNYPIISKRRFAQNKYLLHLSITLNYQNNNKYKIDEFNRSINTVLNTNKKINFVGIDRGEKHLIYSCVIDENSKILSCEHFDEINGTNYVKKLEDIAEERMFQRKNWQQQSSIKNLKDGYISHAVFKLTNLVSKDNNGEINPHSYIVLEDLNSEMKRGRQKIEKQVYQKLETALGKKLNFVVDKEAKEGEIGSIQKALQLTPLLQNYEDLKGKKQFGVMLYTRANYTSITDPQTGWRQTIYIKNGNEDEIKNSIMSSFSEFGFDGKDYYFEYTEDNIGKTWRLYSGKDGKSLPRYRNNKQIMENKNIWVPELIDIVSILDALFSKFDKTKSFKKQINEGVCIKKIEGRNETAWESFRYAIGIIQQIRNSGNTPDDDNFLFSPVRNEMGIHFDTRNYTNNGDLKLITDADANGAYNIARKGLIMNEHIKYCYENNIDTKNLNLLISDNEWDTWLLNREIWKEKLNIYAIKEKKSHRNK